MSPSPSRHAWLIRQTDPDRPVEIGSGVSIGRKDSCRIKITGPTISAVQCEVKWNAQLQQFQVVDRSSNGTFLNGVSVGRGVAVGLTDGDEVQLTKGWQQNAALQFTFVTSIVKLGCTDVTVKEPKPDTVAPLEEDPTGAAPVVPAAAEAAGTAVPAEAAEPAELEQLQEALKEVEARAQALSAELDEVKEKLKAGEEAADAACAQELEAERIQLLAQVDEALKDAAKEEGVQSAHRELMDDCQKVQESLQTELKELTTTQREAVLQEKRRCEENSTACRAVEKRVEDLAAAKQREVKELQMQTRGLISEIHIEGTSLSQLSQCHVPVGELQEVTQGATAEGEQAFESPAKRCKVDQNDAGTLFAETIAMG